MESGNAAGLLGRQLHSFVLEGGAKIKWFQTRFRDLVTLSVHRSAKSIKKYGKLASLRHVPYFLITQISGH